MPKKGTGLSPPIFRRKWRKDFQFNPFCRGTSGEKGLGDVARKVESKSTFETLPITLPITIPITIGTHFPIPSHSEKFVQRLIYSSKCLL
jgi:hypothetical protein